MSKNGNENLDLPECWSDDVRMDVLFSPFRLRKVNPENYDAKLKFWEDMTVRFCESKGSPCFTTREVRWAFQRKDKLPHGIETVVDDLLAKKAIRLHSEFVNDPKNTWSGWLVNSFVRRPLQWTLPKLQKPLEPQDIPYIHLDTLKAQSKVLKKMLEKFAGSIVSFEKIAETNGHGLSKDGLCINLLNLQSLDMVFLEYKTVDSKQRIHLVKVAEKGSTAEPITESDKAVYALEQTEQDLLKTLEEIESEVVKYDKLARENVRQGKRVVAKTYLRKKHHFAKTLDKHSKALDNIQTLLASIHEARGNESILDAYSIGSKTLKSLLTNSKLNTDNVDEIVDTIKETLEVHDEIEESLSNIQPADKAEDQALEEELKLLMQDTSTPVTNVADNVNPTTKQQTNIQKPAPVVIETNGNASKHGVHVISDDELLKHLENLQAEFDSLSTDSVEENKIQDGLEGRK